MPMRRPIDFDYEAERVGLPTLPEMIDAFAQCSPFKESLYYAYVYGASARSELWNDLHDILLADKSRESKRLTDKDAIFMDMLDLIHTTGNNFAADLGAGSGIFTVPLAKRFGRVFAVDNSTENLAIAAAHVREFGLTNVRTVQLDAIDFLAQWRAKVSTEILLDFVCAVHMFYYESSYARILDTLWQIMQCVRPRGKFFSVIKTVDETERYADTTRLYNHFQPVKFHVSFPQMLIELQEKSNGRIQGEIRKRPVRIACGELHPFYRAAMLVLLHDPHREGFDYSGRGPELLAYLHEHFYRAEQQAYVMYQVNDVLILHNTA